MDFTVIVGKREIMAGRKTDRHRQTDTETNRKRHRDREIWLDLLVRQLAKLNTELAT